jgi:FkbM family methyltransferase
VKTKGNSMKYKTNKNLMDLLKEHQIKNYGNKLVRIFKQPIVLPVSKLLELTCKIAKKDLKMKARTFWGDEMMVVFPEIVSCFIYRYGYFEEELTEIFIKYLKKGDVFLDIGTHYGYYSMLGAHIVGASGEVHSFEPTLRTYNIAKHNLNGKANVTVNNNAAWSKSEELTIKDYGTRYSAFNSLFSAKLKDEISEGLVYSENKVNAISIDEYVRNRNLKPNFIKIDAENAEYEILKGMEYVLTEMRPLVSLEVGDVNSGAFENSAACVNFLLARNYKALEIKNETLVEHSALECYAHTNLLFVPK